MATTLKACNVPILAAEVEKCICIQGSMVGRADTNGPQGSGLNNEVSFTLNTIDRHAVAYTFGKTSRPHFKDDAPTYRQLDTANTVNTFDTGESRANELAVQGVPPHYIVRRLMPIECGRLQGFPDGRGEIEQLPADMPEEAAAFWRGVYATDCAIKGKRAQKSTLERVDKLVAWHNSLHTDSAEYKMWGNGMALPNALFFVSRALAQISAEENRPVESLKLGSLFDGSGTMPLCATMCGAKAAWASEVEPYPIAVTKTHLPHMKHLGSVTEINGAEIEPVDIITFGSPCQDLSVAGRRAGLDGARSGLFRQAIRIAKEMLAATGGRYPRFMLWENVPGALSSNKGDDFETVLNELLHLSHANEYVRRNGKWNNYGGYGAVAYRLVNAQYWGVPQRRRRIYAIADTRGESADKVLFERQGNGWHFEPCLPAGEEIAGIAGDGYRWYESMVGRNFSGGGYDPAYTLKIRSGCEGGGKGALVQTDLSATLATNNDQTLFAPKATAFSFDSLASNSMKSKNPNSGCRAVETSKTLDCGQPDPSKNQGGIAIVQEAIGFIKEQNAKAGSVGAGKVSPTMKCDHPPAVAYRVEEQEDVENGSAVH